MPGSLEGKNILVTGSTDGIGLLAAESLVRAGAVVWVHGRDAEKVERSAQTLSRFGARARGFVADLASLEQTSGLARKVAADVPELDVLVNNAAVGFGSDRQRRELSHDGFELRFAVNYLAPFLLTELLLEQWLPSRAVINVSSIGQEPLDFSDLMGGARLRGRTGVPAQQARADHVGHRLGGAPSRAGRARPASRYAARHEHDAGDWRPAARPSQPRRRGDLRRGGAGARAA